jgi:methylthioribulose-1-phosphate dehydratase
MPRHHPAFRKLAELGRELHARGWALGTSGNFSVVTQRSPLRLAISSSGVDKGKMLSAHVMEVDEHGKALVGSRRPSAETLLHLAIIRNTHAGAVLHTHSVWSTILSELHARDAGFTIEGLEMLKGLEGISSHEHREWLPILENSQNMPELAKSVEGVLKAHPCSHGFLLRGHGLYTWGTDLPQAKRHAEILEFLLEVTGRRLSLSGPRSSK